VLLPPTARSVLYHGCRRGSRSGSSRLITVLPTSEELLMNINPSTRKRGLSRPRILVALLVIMLLIGIMGSVRPVQAQDDQPPPPDAGAIFETGQPFREQRHLQILREIEQEPQVALLPARSGLATFGGGAPAAFTDCSAVTDVPQSECEALVDVYITTNG